MGVHSQQTEASEPECELWLCQLALRGVLTLSSWALTCWAFSRQQMAGPSVGSPGFPCYVQLVPYSLLGADRGWAVILPRGLSSASSGSDSTPCADNDIHKRLCQIPSLVWIECILGIQISDACERLPGLLLSIWANTGRLLTSVLSQIAVKEDHAAFIRVCNSLSPLLVRFWGWSKSLVAKGFGTRALAEQCRNEKQWKNTFGCNVVSFGRYQALKWDARLPAMGYSSMEAVASVHRWWKLWPRSGRNQFVSTS